jgi:hypothetical protein
LGCHSKEQEILKFQDTLSAISKLQANIDGEKLQGMCIYIHEYASAVGLSDGNLKAGYSKGNNEDSIYPILGIHEVGYIDKPDQNASIYFDLTSKRYVFRDPDTKSTALQGISVIEDYGTTQTMENLYQSSWSRQPFQHEQTLSQHAIQIATENFLK